MAQSPKSLSQLALQKFKKNFWGVLSLGVISLVGLLALFAYAIAPDNSQNANQMHISIHSKPPGFSVDMLTIPSDLEYDQSFFETFFFGKKNSDTEIPIAKYSFDNGVLTYTPYTGEDVEGISKQLKVGADAENSAFAKSSPRDSRPSGEQSDKSSPRDSRPAGEQSDTSSPRDSRPTGEQSAMVDIDRRTFYLGTDRYGRDLLSRMLVGARISFSIGFVAVLISLLIGIFMGAMAGYFGGWIDRSIMWIINVTWSIPTLLLVIAITLALGKGFWQVFIAVGLTMWVEVARVVRGQVMGVKQMQYVTAARALGYTNSRIIFRHILPNIVAPLIVISAANFAGAILIESGLSFLGIGAQPPMPSWGAMIKDHYSYIILGKPFLALIPGLAIMTLVMAFMLMGNALRDALDVKG